MPATQEAEAGEPPKPGRRRPDEPDLAIALQPVQQDRISASKKKKKKVTGFHHGAWPAQAGLELLGSSDLLRSVLESPGITSVNHHTRLIYYSFLINKLGGARWSTPVIPTPGEAKASG